MVEDGCDASLSFGIEPDDWGFEFALLLGVAGGEAEDVDGDVDEGNLWEVSAWRCFGTVID